MFFSCLSLSAQTIRGVVFNTTSTVEDIKIQNLSNKYIVFTNNNGEFTLDAKTNDTLRISSLFYITQNIIVKSIYAKEPFVIQLKKTNNTLEEVRINGKEKEKIANIETVESNLKNQILEDIKNNPHLYGRMPEGGLDLIQIIGLVAKLFKKKNKVDPFKPISYQNLDALFNNTNSLFNDTLLTETLKVDKDKKFLFFEFVEAKSIDSKLLMANKELQLLEEIIIISNEFNIIIKNYISEKPD